MNPKDESLDYYIVLLKNTFGAELANDRYLSLETIEHLEKILDKTLAQHKSKLLAWGKRQRIEELNKVLRYGLFIDDNCLNIKDRDWTYKHFHKRIKELQSEVHQ